MSNFCMAIFTKQEAETLKMVFAAAHEMNMILLEAESKENNEKAVQFLIEFEHEAEELLSRLLIDCE